MAPCIWDLLFPSTQWQISVSPCPLWPWQAWNPNSLSHFIACLRVWICPVLLSDQLRSYALERDYRGDVSHHKHLIQDMWQTLRLTIEGFKPLITHGVRCWMMTVSTIWSTSFPLQLSNIWTEETVKQDNLSWWTSNNFSIHPWSL